MLISPHCGSILARRLLSPPVSNVACKISGIPTDACVSKDMQMCGSVLDYIEDVWILCGLPDSRIPHGCLCVLGWMHAHAHDLAHISSHALCTPNTCACAHIYIHRQMQTRTICTHKHKLTHGCTHARAEPPHPRHQQCRQLPDHPAPEAAAAPLRHVRVLLLLRPQRERVRQVACLCEHQRGDAKPRV